MTDSAANKPFGNVYSAYIRASPHVKPEQTTTRGIYLAGTGTESYNYSRKSAPRVAPRVTVISWRTRTTGMH
jgi:hypothetical protein